jgi:HAD superfamily hydrolase (TIGR01509 family)
MATVRAVLFDLDDTLFDHRHCARAALLGVRATHTCFGHYDPADMEASHARILEELHLDVLAGRRNLDAARVERFKRLYSWAGVDADPDLASRAARAYREGYLRARTEVRGARALLAMVGQHARVVVVSNNLLDEQQEKLRECRLAEHVHALVVSEEVGVSKPDPRIFHIALDRADVTAGEAVMVGDSWTNDIEGARAAGIRAVWFSRNGEPSPDAEVPTLYSLEPAENALRTILDADRESKTVARREPASALRR